MNIFFSKRNIEYFKHKKSISMLAILAATITLPTEAVEKLTVEGNQILADGTVKSFAGHSLFWSNDGWGGENFYNAEVVADLRDNWDSSIIRAAMGVEHENGYLDSPSSNENKVRAIVDAAIANDMYVIIDWHSHSAESNTSAAIDFFSRMSADYGDFDNVIYEIYNEPVNASWATIKSYAEQVIPAIRQNDPDNLIIVGTPFYSQRVDEASVNPITSSSNIAYTLHFYAGTHFDDIRNNARTALNNGIALFVTEWGTVSASGDGAVNSGNTDAWMSFLLENNISHANWAVNDKLEGASLYNPGGSSLTSSGNKVYEIVKNWPYKIDSGPGVTPTPTPTPVTPTPTPTPVTPTPTPTPTSGGTSCVGVPEYPNWTTKDWSGGEPTHNEAGDQMYHNGQLYVANWYTNSVPGSDASWTYVGPCD